MTVNRETCWALLVGLGLAAGACAGVPDQLRWAAAGVPAAGADPPLTPTQQTELETLKTQLADPARDPKTKRDAALLLLTRPYAQAASALRDFLADPANRPAQIAIAESIASSGLTNQDFIKPLLDMLTGSEPSIRPAAANALAAYKDYGVLEAILKPLSDPKTDRPVRLVIISALSRVLDKKAVDALIVLLNDRDEDIRNAACDSLVKLTSISAFARDCQRWRNWWSQNKDKPPSVWLADLADSLARANLELEKDNGELRKRLAAAMNDLYAATPQAGRDALLTEMLKDLLPEVRLAAARLAAGRVGGGQTIPEHLRAQIQARLTDPVAAIRREAAGLLANAADDQTCKLLMERLASEQSGDVREALYQALGALRNSAAWEQLVAGVEREDLRAAAAAASALARVAEKEPPNEARKAAAAAALRKRYAAAPATDSAALREALLTAMGALADKALSDVMTAALKDPSAAIRLGAVKGLAALRNGELAAAVAPLCADNDRGVRLAAITAVGSLGAADHLDTVLARTDAHVEPDAAVRQQAWTVAMGMLEKADADKLKALAEQLAGRDDAGERLVQVLKLWAAKVPPDNTELWVPIRLQLGESLLAASRPAEAAGELASVHAALLKTRPADAPQVWLKWITALLSCDDASAVAKIAENSDEAQFASARAALQTRGEALKAKKDWDSLVRLASSALERLSPRLPEAQQKALQAMLAEAQAQQRQADRQRVAELVARLTGADEAGRAAAVKELTALKNRAVAPLLAELRAAVAADPPNAATEKAILDLLTVLAPDLKDYNPKAPAAERLTTLDKWIKQNHN